MLTVVCLVFLTLEEKIFVCNSHRKRYETKPASHKESKNKC